MQNKLDNFLCFWSFIFQLDFHGLDKPGACNTSSDLLFTIVDCFEEVILVVLDLFIGLGCRIKVLARGLLMKQFGHLKMNFLDNERPTIMHITTFFSGVLYNFSFLENRNKSDY